MTPRICLFLITTQSQAYGISWLRKECERKKREKKERKSGGKE